VASDREMGLYPGGGGLLSGGAYKEQFTVPQKVPIIFRLEIFQSMKLG